MISFYDKFTKQKMFKYLMYPSILFYVYTNYYKLCILSLAKFNRFNLYLLMLMLKKYDFVIFKCKLNISN